MVTAAQGLVQRPATLACRCRLTLENRDVSCCQRQRAVGGTCPTPRDQRTIQQQVNGRVPRIRIAGAGVSKAKNMLGMLLDGAAVAHRERLAIQALGAPRLPVGKTNNYWRRWVWNRKANFMYPQNTLLSRCFKMGCRNRVAQMPDFF